MNNLLIGISHESFFDSYWALVHFISGLVVGAIVLSVASRRGRTIDKDRYAHIGFSLLLLWEYFELSLRYIDRYNKSLEEYLTVIIPRIFFESEGIINIVSDLTVGSIGLALVYWYTKRERKPLTKS